MKNKIFKNVLFGFGGQIIILLLGIIVPRIMITNYGSDINGFVSTVTQIFTYMALLEAGIGASAKNALYKPISENNKNGISYICSVARHYYRKFTIYYALGVVLMSVILPLIIKTNIDRKTIFIYVILEGLSGVISFYYVQTISTILVADGHAYVNNGINVANRTLSYFVKIVMAYFGLNIILLQLAYFLITIAKVFFYKIYFSKRYGWIDFNLAPKNEKLKDRNAYIITEVAWTIFSSTDMIVLSTFLATSYSSVYGVYNLVFNSLSALINAVYSSLCYILGQTYHKSKDRYIQIHDAFNSIFFGGITIAMCVANVMIIPFVKLYTHGVNDINYIYPQIPILFSLIQMLSWSRYVSGNLSGVAGYAKPTSYVSLIEALINVVCSIILVQFMGLSGVLIATVIALPLKVVYLTWLSDKKILGRSYNKTIKILGGNFILFLITIVVKNHFIIEIYTFTQFIVYAIIVTIFFAIIGIITNYLLNNECFKVLFEILKKKKNKN